jgi:chromosome segregation ATPase
MQMNRLIALSLAAATACGTLALSPRQAAAQSTEAVDLSKLAALQADLQTETVETTALAAAITKALDDAKPLLEQHKANIEQTKALEPEGEALKAALSAEAAEAEKQRAAAAQHDAACPRQTKDAALVAKCNGEIEHLNAWAAQITAEIARLEPSKIRYNGELEDIRKRDQQVIGQLNALRTADAADRTRLEEKRARVKELRASLAAGKKRCRELEQAAQKSARTSTPDPASAEALGYCRALALANAAATPPTAVAPPPTETPK